MKFTWKDIPQAACPVMVWADKNGDWIASKIKERTHANYSHVMLMVGPGVMASQGFSGYKLVPIDNYIGTLNTLKFIGIRGITDFGRECIIDSVNKKLNGPWYRKMYDFLGIFGQLTGLTWIQTPFFDYCSEDMPYHLQATLKKYPQEFDPILSAAIEGFPKNGSPGVHDEYSKKFRDTCFPLIGKQEGDE